MSKSGTDSGAARVAGTTIEGRGLVYRAPCRDVLVTVERLHRGLYPQRHTHTAPFRKLGRVEPRMLKALSSRVRLLEFSTNFRIGFVLK